MTRVVQNLLLILMLALECFGAPGSAISVPAARSKSPAALYFCPVQIGVVLGEQYDPDLGLYYLRARFYSPRTGRFWNMDSFEGFHTRPASLHKYGYCEGDPINHVDPSGHFLTVGFSIGSLNLVARRMNYESRKAPVYASAIDKAKLWVVLLGAGISVSTVSDIVDLNDGEIEIYFHYTPANNLTALSAGSDVTTRFDLSWSQAVAIQFQVDFDIMHMYTVLARRGEVGDKRGGPEVSPGIPQFKLRVSIAVPRLIKSRTLTKPSL